MKTFLVFSGNPVLQFSPLQRETEQFPGLWKQKEFAELYNIQMIMESFQFKGVNFSILAFPLGHPTLFCRLAKISFLPSELLQEKNGRNYFPQQKLTWEKTSFWTQHTACYLIRSWMKISRRHFLCSVQLQGVLKLFNHWQTVSFQKDFTICLPFDPTLLSMWMFLHIQPTDLDTDGSVFRNCGGGKIKKD